MEKLSHRSTAIDWNAHSEEEARLFSKQLGDIGRKESKRFSEQYPTLAQRLRAANKTEAERQEQEFRFNLMADAFLDRDVGHSVALSPEQRIHFLEYLYSECLRFFFRMWNERDYAEREEQERVKLERLLRKVSDDVIVNAFRKMVMAVRKTSSETKPIRPEEFESESAFEQARLAIFRPSAVAYDRFRELTERHLEQLKADNDTGKDAQTK